MGTATACGYVRDHARAILILIIFASFLSYVQYVGQVTTFSIGNLLPQSMTAVSNVTMKNELLLTIATSFDDPYYLWTLVRSFRDANGDAQIVVFVPQEQEQSPNLITMADLANLTVVSYPMANMVVNDRFKLWLEFLRARPAMYDDVITVDARDVYFQQDPFRQCKIFEMSDESCRFAIAREDQRYVSVDDPNVKRCYGEEAAHQMGIYNLLNAGFLAGSQKGIVLVFERLVRELETRGSSCLDQVILNDLIWNRHFEPECHIRIEPDSQSCIATLGILYNHYPDTAWLWQGKNDTNSILGIHGDDTPVAAVHMYDRNAKHLEYVRRRWPWPPSSTT